MKFYTRKTKPKLYDVLIIAAAAVAAVAVLSIVGKGLYAVACALICDALIAYSVVRLISAFVGQIKYNPYSYNTIYYPGFALFLSSVLVTNIILTVDLITKPDTYKDYMIINTLTGSAKNYMLISAPFIIVFSIALCISNIALIKHEGKKPTNFLGVALSLFLMGGEAFLFTVDYYATGSQTEVMIHDLFTNLFAALYLYFECMIIGAIIANTIVSRHEPEPECDFIIILGCWLGKDGKITPLLRGRVDRAVEFAEKQEKLTGKKAVFVTSGGKGSDEQMSESAGMKNYLLECGIPEERIIEEDKSTTTVENMVFSKQKIDEINKNAKVAFSTTGYHVFRSGIFAGHAKIRAEGIGAKTKWYFWPNAAVREFGGLLIAHKRKQAVIFVCLCLAYVALTILQYKLM